MPKAQPSPVAHAPSNPFDVALEQFDRAADILGLDAGLRETLWRPKRQLIVSIPVRMDDGSIRVYEGYRVFYQVDPSTRRVVVLDLARVAP